MTPKSSLTGNQIQAVLDLNRKIGAERDIPALLRLMAREAARLMEAERATVFLLDQETCELWSQVTLDGESIRFDARLGIAGAALMTGQMINVPDAQKDSRFYQSIDTRTKFRTRSVLAIPLRTPSGNTIGTFQVLNKKRGTFSGKDEAIGQALAEQAALALDTAQLVEELKRNRRQLEGENSQLWKEVEGRFATQNLIGNSPRMQGIVRLIDQIQDSSVDVLITGENGTGKEMVAKAIHYNSPRARKPFVALNCAALPDNLIESELFGIEKGVATGVEARIGKFEQAQGGTLFLDEIGDMGLGSQGKILRVLQERVLERVGGRSGIPIDVRMVAATNKNLEGVIASGTFREDLYYRLKVIHLHTPALRDIPEDIPILASFFLGKYCKEMDKDQKRLSPGTLRTLQAYDWPGNIRQLENEIKRLVVTIRKTTISEEDLDDSIRQGSHGKETNHPGHRPQNLHQAVEDLERGMIQNALQVCHHNQVQTAKKLGLSRQGLIKKMRRYGLGVS